MSTTDDPRPAPAERDDVVTETVLDAEPAKVWRALTEPAIVADWLGAAGEPAPDGRLVIASERDRPAVGIEIVAADPPDRVSYAWREQPDGDRESGRDSIVTFELSPLGGDRTHLRIVHRLLAPASRSRPIMVRRCGPRATASRRASAPPMRLAA